MSERLLRPAPRSEPGLDAIARRGLAQWGAAQMATYPRGIDARMRWLGENPGRGRPRDEVWPGFRSWREGEHVIFCVGTEAPIAIVGVPRHLMHVGRCFGAGRGVAMGPAPRPGTAQNRGRDPRARGSVAGGVSPRRRVAMHLHGTEGETRWPCPAWRGR